MNLLVSVTLDGSTAGGTGQGLVSWFETALTWPLAGWLDREREGHAESLATALMREGADRVDFSLAQGGWETMRAELARGPETADVLVLHADADRPAVHVRSTSVLARRPNAELQLFFLGDDTACVGDAVFCAPLVAFRRRPGRGQPRLRASLRGRADVAGNQSRRGAGP